MNYQQSTQIPNNLFDIYLSSLNFSELKILLYILRQTNGWIYKNGKRKERDRITHSQYSSKTGLSRRIISETIQSLIDKKLIKVSDYEGNQLHSPRERKGKTGIYYAPCLQSYAKYDKKIRKKLQNPMQNRVYNKNKITKLKSQKSFSSRSKQSDWQRIQEILHHQ